MIEIVQTAMIVPVAETHVLSMQVSEWVSKIEYDRFMSQFTVSIS